MMTASPGRTRTSEKMTRDTSNNTSSPCKARRAMYVRIPCLLSELLELPARRLLRHPRGLCFIRTVAREPAIGVRARMDVRLRDSVVLRHDRRDAGYVVAQVIRTGALDGMQLLPWSKS